MMGKINTIGSVNPEGLDEIAEEIMKESMRGFVRPSLREKLVENYGSFWRIYGVEHRGIKGYVDMRKKPLWNGIPKTQDELADYSRKAISNGQFYAASLPLYHAIFKTLFHNKDGASRKEIEDIRMFVRNAFYRWPNTLTRIVYENSGKDKVVHNYGLTSQYEIDYKVAGKKEMVKKASDRQLYASLFGTDDIFGVHEVYKWMIEKNACLWRLSNKPRRTSKRTVRFGISSDSAVIGCSGDLKCRNIVVGVRTEKIINF